MFLTARYRRIMSTPTRALGAALAACALVAPVPCAVSAAAPAPIAITASNFKFAPATITVHAGQPVTLTLTSTEGVHGLQSDDLKIPQTMIVPGQKQTVTFTPAKPGTYIVHCSVPCGAGHADMALTVRVAQ